MLTQLIICIFRVFRFYNQTIVMSLCNTVFYNTTTTDIRFLFLFPRGTSLLVKTCKHHLDKLKAI